MLLSLSAGCASSVEPSPSDGAASLEASVQDARAADGSEAGVERAPPFVASPLQSGPYGLCGAIGVGSIAALEFDPSRDALAVGTYAGFVRWIDGRDGHPIGTLFAHRYGLSSIAFSPDRVLLATAGRDFDSRDVRLWNVSDGAAVRFITVPSDPIRVEFTPDGSALIVTQRNAVSRYAVRDGSLAWTVPHVEGPIEASSVAPDGGSLVFVAGDAIVQLRLSDGALGPRVTDSFARNRRAIALSRDGASVIVGYQYYAPDGASPAVIARVIDLATSATQLEIQGLRSVNALRVSPSGDEVAIAFDARGYERWAVRRAGAWLPRAERTAVADIAHESSAIAFDRDGAQLALASADAVRVFDARADRAPTRSFEAIEVQPGALGWGGGGSVELSSDGSELLVGARGRLYLFSVATQEALHRFDDALGVGAFSPDSQRIVTGAGPGRVALWRRSDWTPQYASTVAELASLRFIDGARFAAGGRDAVIVHAAGDGAPLRRLALTRRQLPTFELQASRDALRIAAATYGGFGGGVDVFDLDAGARATSIEGNFRSRSNGVFLRDGRLLLARATGVPYALFDVDAGSRTALAITGAPPVAVALTSDEQLLVESTSDGSTTIRRGVDGPIVQSLGRIGPSATSLGAALRVAANGAVIVRTGGQGTLELWCRR